MASKSKDLMTGFVVYRLPYLLKYLASSRYRDVLRLKVSSVCIDVVDDEGGRIVRIGRRSAHYIPDIMKSFEYYHGSARSVAWIGYSGEYKLVDFSSPRYHEIFGFDDFPIFSPSLVEPYVTALQYLEYGCLKNGDVVLDLGCYSGLTSIAFSKVVGAAGRVISIEPDPCNYECALKNIAFNLQVNDLANITVLHYAISSSCGAMEFSGEGSMGSASTGIVGTYRGKVSTVKCLDLSTLSALEKLDKVDFIKMDIEGSELDVIQTAGDFFRAYKPRIIIEPHVIDGVLSDSKVIECLKSYGYACRHIEQTGVDLPLIYAEPLM